MVGWAGEEKKEISRKGVSTSILVPPVLGRVPTVFFHRDRFDIGNASHSPAYDLKQRLSIVNIGGL